MKWKILLLIVSMSSIAACRKNKEEGLNGRFVEVTPMAGQTILKFLPGGLMIRQEANAEYKDTFLVRVSANTITLKPAWGEHPGIVHEFRMIDGRSFEIENMRPQIPEAPKSFMLFRK